MAHFGRGPLGLEVQGLSGMAQIVCEILFTISFRRNSDLGKGGGLWGSPGLGNLGFDVVAMIARIDYKTIAFLYASQIDTKTYYSFVLGRTPCENNGFGQDLLAYGPPNSLHKHVCNDAKLQCAAHKLLPSHYWPLLPATTSHKDLQRAIPLPEQIKSMFQLELKNGSLYFWPCNKQSIGVRGPR